MQVRPGTLKSSPIHPAKRPVAASLRNRLERIFLRINWREIARLLAMREDERI
jgi:hypothetical protein